jgi:hypothetical protein
MIPKPAQPGTLIWIGHQGDLATDIRSKLPDVARWRDRSWSPWKAGTVAGPSSPRGRLAGMRSLRAWRHPAAAWPPSAPGLLHWAWSSPMRSIVGWDPPAAGYLHRRPAGNRWRAAARTPCTGHGRAQPSMPPAPADRTRLGNGPRGGARSRTLCARRLCPPDMANLARPSFGILRRAAGLCSTGTPATQLPRARHLHRFNEHQGMILCQFGTCLSATARVTQTC